MDVAGEPEPKGEPEPTPESPGAADDPPAAAQEAGEGGESEGLLEGGGEEWTYAELVKKHPLTTIGGSLPVFFGFIFVTATTPIMPFFMDTIGADDSAIGLILSANYIAQIAGGLLVAPLVRFVPNRRILLLALGAVHICSIGLVAAHPTVWTLAVERAAGGFRLGMAKVIARSLIRLQLPQPARGKAFGIMNALSNAGLLMGPAFSALAYSAGGMRLTFICLAVVVGIDLLIVACLPAHTYDIGQEGGKLEAGQEWTSWWANLQLVAKQRSTGGLVIVAMWEGVWFGLLFLLLPLQLANYFQLSSAHVAVIWICFDVGAVPSSLLGGFLADWLEPYYVLAVTLVLKAGMEVLSGYGRMLPSDSLTGLLLMAIGCGLCMDLWDVGMSSRDKLAGRAAEMLHQLKGEGYDDIVFGWIQSTEQLAVIITFWSGVPLDRAVGWPVLMFVHAGLSLCVLYPLTFWLMRPIRAASGGGQAHPDLKKEDDVENSHLD